MTDFQAVIFDMDGTLTDSEHWWDEVRRGLASQAGRPWPATATIDIMGMSTQEWSKYLVEAVGIETTPAEIAEATIAGMIAKYQAGVPLLPGADQIVSAMAAKYPIAICSSSPQRLIEAVAASTGWDEFLGAVVSTELVERGKPAPDGYLLAAQKLGVDPFRCLIFEDASNGILAALATGATVVAVPPHFHPPATEILARCDMVIDSLTEFDEAALAKLLA